jgi:hypothetical protein
MDVSSTEEEQDPSDGDTLLQGGVKSKSEGGGGGGGDVLAAAGGGGGVQKGLPGGPHSGLTALGRGAPVPDQYMNRYSDLVIAAPSRGC